MAKNDVEPFESLGESLPSLRRELETKLADLDKKLEGKVVDLDRKLDPKIEGKVPIWAGVIFLTIIGSVGGVAYTSLMNENKALQDKVHQLETSLAVASQKMDDFRNLPANTRRGQLQ